MADTINYGTTTDKDGKDRYFDRIADLPPAAEFGPGIAIIKEGPTLKISDGAAWTDIAATGAWTIPSYSWAAKPDATTNSGPIRITDIGVNGSEWLSNGTRWVLRYPVTVHVVTTAPESTNAVGRASLATTPVLPAGALYPGLKIRCNYKAVVTTVSTAESVTVAVNMGNNADGITSAVQIGATVQLSGATKQASIETDCVVMTNTTVQTLQAGGASQSYTTSTSGSQAGPATISDVSSNGTYISVVRTNATGGLTTTSLATSSISLEP